MALPRFRHATVCTRPHEDGPLPPGLPSLAAALEWPPPPAGPDPGPEARRIGLVLANVRARDLFRDEARTVAAVLDAVEYAARQGARSVSFVGLIPSATRFLAAVADAVRERGSTAARACVLTTGHGATVAAFALNLQAMLRLSGRSLAAEDVAVVGCGSIGQGIAELLLSLGERPRSMALVDLPRKRASMEALQRRLEEGHGYRASRLHYVATAASMIPDEVVRSCSVFLTAVAGEKVLDLPRLRPGAIVVDDSYPFGFDSQAARARIAAQGDLLLTIAGGIRGKAPFRVIPGDPQIDCTQPEPPPGSLTPFQKGWQIASIDPRETTACLRSALLTPELGLPPVTGPVTAAHALDTYRRLSAAGYTGTHPYFLNSDGSLAYKYPPEAIASHARLSARL